MLKTIKLFSWFKSHWKLSLGIAIILFVAVAAIQGVRANKWHNKHLRLEGKLEEQKTDQDRFYEEVRKERIARNIEKTKEKEERESLKTQIQQEKKEGEEARLALKKEKKKTATLPPTELVAQINERIGEELKLTQSGFLFSRLGTNRTLDKFKDGEFYLSEYNRHLKVIGDLEANAASFDISLTKCEEAEATNLKGWDDCRETLATAIKDKEALEKAGKASMFWATVKGVAGGGLAVFILDKIFGLF